MEKSRINNVEFRLNEIRKIIVKIGVKSSYPPLPKPGDLGSSGLKT
jgi:hypothetical protein